MEKKTLTNHNTDKEKGIDAKLESTINREAAKWREIFRCILDVTLFLASRNFPFRGSNS